jgi:hypothetical protein
VLESSTLGLMRRVVCNPRKNALQELALPKGAIDTLLEATCALHPWRQNPWIG